MRRLGFCLALLPMACWWWQLRDPCELQGDAWQQCWAHHAKPKDHQHG